MQLKRNAGDAPESAEFMHGISYRTLGRGFLCGGVVCLALTAAMNYFQGEMMGVTVAGKWLNSLSSVVVDIVGIVMFGLAAGAKLGERKWGAFLVFTGVMLASAGYSMTSMISFQAAERMSASANRQAAINRQEKADDASRGFIKWLSELRRPPQGESRSERRDERRDFLKAASTEITKYRETTGATFVLPDAGAKAISDMTGWQIERVQISLVSYLACLLILLKVFCFPSATFFLTAGKVKREPKGNGGNGGGKNSTEPRKEPEKPAGNITSFPGKDNPKPAVLKLATASSVPAINFRQGPVDELLQQLVARGNKWASQSQMARFTGRSEGYVSKLLAQAESQGKISRSRAGNRKTVRVRMGDGGGRQAIAIG